MGKLLGLLLLLPFLVGEPVTTFFFPYLATNSLACGMNPHASELASMFAHDHGQQRTDPVCNMDLVEAAQAHADDMAGRGYFAHETPEGLTANERVYNAGCELPGYYPAFGNNLESLALNYPTAGEAWTGLLHSPPHRMHLLGLHPSFDEQVSYGVGYARSPWGITWVIMTGLCATD